ncbi:hypothetical protein ES703_117293 [subsurface metagenome]
MSFVALYLLKRENLHKFLDVGAGTGKYGKMVKKNFPSACVEAVEIDSSYIDNYSLRAIYDHVYCMDVNDFIERFVDYKCDVCIIGDCIEHLRKSVGIDVLHFFVYRSKYVIVAFPVGMPQGSWAGHKQEAHISIWNEQDFSLFKNVYIPKSFMRLVIVEGYLK